MNFLVRSFLILSLLFANFVSASEASLTQRSLYKRWMTSYQSLTMSEQQKLLAALKDYPLYPYAKIQYLEVNLKTVPKNEIVEFVKNNRNFPQTAALARAYLTELTNRKDWKSISNFPHNDSTASVCQYQYAQYQLGQRKQPLAAIEKLWLNGKELPSECDPLLKVWERAGRKSINMILARVAVIIESHNFKLAEYLIKQIPNNHKTVKSHLLALVNNPRKLKNFSDNVPASSYTKKVVMASYKMLARTDVDFARSLLPSVIKKQKLNLKETQKLKNIVATYYLNDDATKSQIKWRDTVIANSRDTDLIEKRIRLAIGLNDYQQIDHWLKKLKIDDQLKDEWQYWRARTLLNKESDNQTAKAILSSLAEKRGFYGMISAQAINQRYKLNNKSEALSSSDLAELRHKYDELDVVRRITELRHWDMISESSYEWSYFLRNLPQKEQTKYEEFAQYAYQRGWGELSIQSTIYGKLWDNWTERLPIMYQSLYKEALKDTDISLSYALAITRQESALDPTVQSPVGASGLMQLMPATAEFTAKKLAKLADYSKSQLFDPKTNIKLGTHYLNYVYQHNSNNRILSSAAYNAGPHRVTSWLEKSKGKLDAVAFIESIPFNETRNYVKSVLVYDYVYQTKLNNGSIVFLSPDELNRKY